MECLPLRVKDFDLSCEEITVRQGEGGKDRMSMLPESAKKALKDHRHAVRESHAGGPG